MTNITHIAVGTVIAKVALSNNIIQADPLTVYAVAILFSNLPDFDLLLLGIRRSLALKLNHRIQSFMHFPLFWVVLYFVIGKWAPFHIHQTIKPYMQLTLISLGLYFLLDMIGVHGGICWFGPFSKKQFSFTRLFTWPDTLRMFLLTYRKSNVFKMEILIWIGSLIYLFVF